MYSGAKIQDYPQPMPLSMSTCSTYTYNNLPTQHWKKYMYAARFIELVRNKTPKVTLFTNLAKCQLMETLTEFEAYFYAGQKITKSSSNTIKAYNEHGLIVGSTVEQLYNLWPSDWQHFQQCLEKCIMIERKMNEIQIDEEDCCLFPITVGRKPITLAEHGIMMTKEINRGVPIVTTPRTQMVKKFKSKFMNYK